MSCPPDISTQMLHYVKRNTLKKEPNTSVQTQGTPLSFTPWIQTATKSYPLIFWNTSFTLSFPQSSPLPEVFLKGRALEEGVKFHAVVAQSQNNWLIQWKEIPTV